MKTKFLLPLLMIGLMIFPLGAQSQLQKKKVAIYVARDNGNQTMVSYDKFFATELQLAVTRSAKYHAVERTGKFLELLSREQSYQRTGQVDESKIAELGKQEGVNFVLSVDMTDFGNNNIYVAWKLIDVETAIVQDGDSEMKTIANMVVDLKSFSEALTKRITGGGMSTSMSPQYGGGTQASGMDYTETAFGINMKMVYVEGGSFVMRCTGKQESDCYDSEKNRVTLDGFYIGETEITQAQWRAVMGTNPSYFNKGDNYPVEQVSWNDAQAFCQELSRMTGKTYLLPTEAQWEYAARGGKKAEGSKYSGSYASDAVAWYSSNSGGSTHPVKSKRANVLGLYDMIGNVSEWCSDWQNAPDDSPSGFFLVIRGGEYDFNCGVFNCLVSFRYDIDPDSRSRATGFRVVCIP